MTDLDIAILVDTLYDNTQPNGLWDVGPFSTGDVYWAIRYVEGKTVVVFRGSVTPVDWTRDAISEFFWIIPGYEELGILPLGFSLGMGAAFDAIKPHVNGPVVATGHSLAGPHSAIFAGMCVLREIPVDRLVTFESPRPGAHALKALLQHVPKACYQNAFDPVCDVPSNPPFLHLCAPIKLDEPPGHEESLDPFQWHHISWDIEGLKKLTLPDTGEL